MCTAAIDTPRTYAAGFDGVLEPGLGMVTSFEVWEHFAEPVKDLAALFACGPKALFISTGIYLQQGEKWPIWARLRPSYLFLFTQRHGVDCKKFRLRLRGQGRLRSIQPKAVEWIAAQGDKSVVLCSPLPPSRRGWL